VCAGIHCNRNVGLPPSCPCAVEVIHQAACRGRSQRSLACHFRLFRIQGRAYRAPGDDSPWVAILCSFISTHHALCALVQMGCICRTTARFTKFQARNRTENRTQDPGGEVRTAFQGCNNNSQDVRMQVSKANTVRGLHTSWLPLVEMMMNFVLNYCLHAVILFVVVASPGMWSSPVYYTMAVNGMLYTNWVNARAFWSSPLGAWLHKHVRSAVPDVAALATHVKLL
jgi:hypothetical protein